MSQTGRVDYSGSGSQLQNPEVVKMNSGIPPEVLEPVIGKIVQLDSKPSITMALPSEKARQMIQLLGPILGAVMAKHGITHFRKEQDNQLVAHEDRVKDLIWLAREFVERINA